MRAETLAARRHLYLLARLVVARNYRRRLTLAEVARATSSSPRQVQRAYAQFGLLSFEADLRTRRMAAAARLLAEQPAIPVATVARLVGYRQASHFARAFRGRFGVAPAHFRERSLAYSAQAGERSASASSAGTSVSAPASRMRIDVPPPAADSAQTLPPCCSTT